MKQQLARATGLSHITGYPLLSHEELVGVLAVYTRREAPGDLLLWWRLYAQLSAARLSNELSRQEKDSDRAVEQEPQRLLVSRTVMRDGLTPNLAACCKARK